MGYHTKREKVSTFSFSLGKSDLLEKWVKFAYQNDWFPTKKFGSQNQTFENHKSEVTHSRLRFVD